MLSPFTAMLTVEDEAFWEGAEPVEFGDLPQLQAAVTVVGYPIGEPPRGLLRTSRAPLSRECAE